MLSGALSLPGLHRRPAPPCIALFWGVVLGGVCSNVRSSVDGPISDLSELLPLPFLGAGGGEGGFPTGGHSGPPSLRRLILLGRAALVSRPVRFKLTKGGWRLALRGVASRRVAAAAAEVAGGRVGSSTA